LLTDEEITMLSIRRGTLTDEERNKMKGHAISTWRILNQVQFPAEYANVPAWAASHHELLNATGYTKGLTGNEIPKEVRLLTILDIFEALTAKDRPYKQPVPLDETWKILDRMVREGAIDGEILAEFRESRAWEQIIDQETKGGT
jgi:HD-GYP domain-containing protein (c-di-GMP phosphodiesterase class II)